METKWHVLTGAACCGKTSLIDLLSERGFQTIPESARQYIDLELAKGRCFEEMFGNAADEMEITRLQWQTEYQAAPDVVAFLDRALPDSVTFFRFCGIDPNEVLPFCFRHRYASVFVLDRLPFLQDGARLNHDETSDLLDQWLVRDYGALGYDVVRVPVLPLEERLAFLLDRLSA